MEYENYYSSRSTTITCTADDHNKESRREDDGDIVQLPGFRFHPTDQELVGFYLKRKVENRPITIQLIKLADIYKYDPWDLPKSGGNVGDDKEWYFFCKRGRKYRNSIRPNRVTGSGFWKATGIDKPIYSSGGRDCIGLKKSLVYYRGCAGKGTKTDWMMHEFRLPLPKCSKSNLNDQEAEVWTLCRILKKNVSYRRFIPDITTMNDPIPDASSKTCSSVDSSHHQYNFDFSNAPAGSGHADHQQFPAGQYDLIASQQDSSSAAANASILGFMADWEDLRSIVDCATVDTIDNPFYL